MKINNALVGIVLFVVVIGVFIYLFMGPQGKTLLYFNAESDLPDPMIYEKRGANATGPPAHIIEVNKSYDIFFTIASLEKNPTTYTCEVKSSLINKKDTITLSPGDARRVHVQLTPQESKKWTLDSNSSSESENVIDVTRNSWLAERKDFKILVREGSLPMIVEENYHLPISSDVAHFGRIYHINISSLDELRTRPFIKEYVTQDEDNFEKTHSTDLIKLSIVNEKLVVLVKSQKLRFTSEVTPFVVKLFSEKGMEDIKIDSTTNIESIQRIDFLYKIK